MKETSDFSWGEESDGVRLGVKTADGPAGSVDVQAAARNAAPEPSPLPVDYRLEVQIGDETLSYADGPRPVKPPILAPGEQVVFAGWRYTERPDAAELVFTVRTSSGLASGPAMHRRSGKR